MTVGDRAPSWISLLMVPLPPLLAERDRLGRLAAAPKGSVTTSGWRCEDGWLVVYSSTSVVGGSLHGKFFTQAFSPSTTRSPSAPRSRRSAADHYALLARLVSSRPELATGYFESMYERTFTKRNLARKRALQIYADHSPEWAIRNGY